MKEFIFKVIFVLVAVNIFFYNVHSTIKIEINHRIYDTVKIEHDSAGLSGFEIRIK